MRQRLLITAALLLAAAAPAQAQPPLDVLNATRAAYPTPMTKAQLSDFLNRVATQMPGWGMLRKDGGNNCPTSRPDVSISCDWLVHIPTRWGWDVLTDQENSARVLIGNNGDIGAGAEYVNPWPTDGGGGGGGGGNPGGGTGGGAVTRLDLQVLEDNIITRTGNLTRDLQDTLERMFGCQPNGKDPVSGEPCATAQDNARAIRGVSEQVKAHDEKVNGLVELFKKPATWTAIIGVVSTLLVQQKVN